ncbi:hypothetical protein CO046_04485 [Candidatus Peregrinibacteria bacterium CG_4_9_14_0_2_um_filter_53_11]|nr:MAG: hypothetical protein CO046_04485 [Candidatus Peregrinibacteria bacterium CG_4_9_14_0_2_um_filter_53_11]
MHTSPKTSSFLVALMIALSLGLGLSASSTPLAYAAESIENPTKNLASPNPIPCVPSLPCIQEATQESGKATREYILDTFGSSFIAGFLGLIAISSVIFLIVGGAQLLFAAGNDDAIGRAKRTILWSIAGLVLAMLSVGIVSIISKLNL